MRVASMIQLVDARPEYVSARRHDHVHNIAESLESRELLSAGALEFINPHPVQDDQFGLVVAALTNGNVVITAPNDDASGGSALDGTGFGAVYLFSGQTGALISTLNGSHPGDFNNATVTPLTNGNFVIDAPNWNSNTGAVTWGSGTAGVSGTITSANSLVDTVENEPVFNLRRGVTALSNGNYVVDSPEWSNHLGAVTFGNGSTGVNGTISASNSLVGSADNDQVGFGGVTTLSNGNYVVDSYGWSGVRGAITFANGTTGITGAVSASNSLVGIASGDSIGGGAPFNGGGIIALSNGNYLISSPEWNHNRGAVTFARGVVGITGTISASNSLIGANNDDYVGGANPVHDLGLGGGVTVLSNGNYVVASPDWNGESGAVTWGSGTVGTFGLVTAIGSLTGNPSDEVGFGGATPLSNGNYVVDSPFWRQNSGAATFENGSSVTTGVVGANNSLIGNPGDYVGYGVKGGLGGGITALTNGNYVVDSPAWNGMRGAATFGSGTSGVTGMVSVINSVVGSNVEDSVGYFGITALTNGNYVVDSEFWHNSGAATFGNGISGISGIVSDTNSLVGSVSVNDIGDLGVTALSNGNYVVGSHEAATFGNGVSGITGEATVTNSLVHDFSPMHFLDGGITALTSGNYVVSSIMFVPGGAATFGNGVAGVVGIPDGENSVFANANSTAPYVTADNSHGKFYAAFPFDGTGHVYRGSATTGFSFQTTPTVTAIDAGGVYNTKPFPASATVKGIGGVTVVGTTSFTYYIGPTVSGTGTMTAPTNVGTYTVVASFVSSDPSYTNATSAPVTFRITPGAASKVVFTQSPTTAKAGAVITPAFKVSVEDKYGNVVTSDNSTVKLTVKSGPGKFAAGSTITVKAVNGVATFTNLKLNTIGMYTIAAADGSLSSAISGKLTITHTNPKKLTFPQAISAGTHELTLSDVVASIEETLGGIGEVSAPPKVSNVDLVIPAGDPLVSGTRSVTSTEFTTFYQRLMRHPQTDSPRLPPRQSPHASAST